MYLTGLGKGARQTDSGAFNQEVTYATALHLQSGPIDGTSCLVLPEQSWPNKSKKGQFFPLAHNLYSVVPGGSQEHIAKIG